MRPCVSSLRCASELPPTSNATRTGATMMNAMMMLMNSPHRRHCLPFFTTLYLIISFFIHLKSCLASDRIDGRFSFSLTTFDSTGKLRQVERATEAALLGTPLVAVCLQDKIIMACPQALASPFMTDDGTARYNQITRNIVVSHSGVSADGRVLTAAAQRMAVEHAYTFDEPIPVESLLEGMSLLFQEYTMKAGSRPFGCSLLVAHVSSPEEDGSSDPPRLYRIDPSGAVQTMSNYAVIGSLENKGSLAEALDVFAKEATMEGDKNAKENDEEKLMRILENAIGRPPFGQKSDDVIKPRSNYLLASLCNKNGLQVRRQQLDTKTSK